MESNPLYPSIIPLFGSSRHHKWGTQASESEAARIHYLNRFCTLDPQEPYSEFVISTLTTDDGAVFATDPSITLRDHLNSLEIEVEPSMVDLYHRLHANGLPFILKIVSVAAPQSVHVHPGDEYVKNLPGRETGSDPHAFGKASMLVALGNVELLCGFRPAAGIVVELSRVPEFADAVGRPETDNFVHVVKTSSAESSDIRNIASNLLGRKKELIRTCLQATVDRFRKMPEEAVTDSDRRLISLQSMYPDDPMCFAVYLLNHVTLEHGNSIFIGTQQPISVFSGEYIEASTSDEVSFNAGLCHNDVHVDEFLDCLSYDDSVVEVSSSEQCFYSCAPFQVEKF